MRFAEAHDKKQHKKVAKGTTTLDLVDDVGVKVPVELIAIAVAVADLAMDELVEVSVVVIVVVRAIVAMHDRDDFDQVSAVVPDVGVVTPTKMVVIVLVVPIVGIVSIMDVAKGEAITNVGGSIAAVTEVSNEPVHITVDRAMPVIPLRIVRYLVDSTPVEQGVVLGIKGSLNVLHRAIERSVAFLVMVRITVLNLVVNG